MPKFRKKPVVIEAMQLRQDNWVKVLAWTTGNIGIRKEASGEISLALTTVHGEEAIARTDDWIIPEPVEGRYYPCKPDIFAETYEPVSD
jgi:hypothetical protein